MICSWRNPTRADSWPKRVGIKRRVIRVIRVIRARERAALAARERRWSDLATHAVAASYNAALSLVALSWWNGEWGSDGAECGCVCSKWTVVARRVSTLSARCTVVSSGAVRECDGEKREKQASEARRKEKTNGSKPTRGLGWLRRFQRVCAWKRKGKQRRKEQTYAWIMKHVCRCCSSFWNYLSQKRILFKISFSFFFFHGCSPLLLWIHPTRSSHPSNLVCYGLNQFNWSSNVLLRVVRCENARAQMSLMIAIKWMQRIHSG